MNFLDYLQEQCNCEHCKDWEVTGEDELQSIIDFLNHATKKVKNEL